MSINDHGKCVHCDFDLNGDYVYDTFFEKYEDHPSALAAASMYGARKGYGRWGKEIYIKGYDENYNKLPSYYKCPQCGEKCYLKEKQDEQQLSPQQMDSNSD